MKRMKKKFWLIAAIPAFLSILFSAVAALCANYLYILFYENAYEDTHNRAINETTRNMTIQSKTPSNKNVVIAINQH